MRKDIEFARFAESNLRLQKEISRKLAVQNVDKNYEKYPGSKKGMRMEHSKSNYLNYKKIYAIKSEREKQIKSICPGIPYRSGIYVFYRDDETGLHMAYCGQAVSLCERCASHLSEYDHIGLSLKKRGFYSEDNPYGWKLIFKECKREDLDKNEQLTILQFANKGFQLYNKTSGSQGSEKSQIAEYKPAKGYRDGLKQGQKNLARELSYIIDTHLTVSLKEGKENNKVSQRAFEKFKGLLDERTYQ